MEKSRIELSSRRDAQITHRSLIFRSRISRHTDAVILSKNYPPALPPSSPQPQTKALPKKKGKKRRKLAVSHREIRSFSKTTAKKRHSRMPGVAAEVSG